MNHFIKALIKIITLNEAALYISVFQITNVTKLSQTNEKIVAIMG